MGSSMAQSLISRITLLRQLNLVGVRVSGGNVDGLAADFARSAGFFCKLFPL